MLARVRAVVQIACTLTRAYGLTAGTAAGRRCITLRLAPVLSSRRTAWPELKDILDKQATTQFKMDRQPKSENHGRRTRSNGEKQWSTLFVHFSSTFISSPHFVNSFSQLSRRSLCVFPCISKPVAAHRLKYCSLGGPDA